MNVIIVAIAKAATTATTAELSSIVMKPVTMTSHHMKSFTKGAVTVPESPMAEF